MLFLSLFTAKCTCVKSYSWQVKIPEIKMCLLAVRGKSGAVTLRVGLLSADNDRSFKLYDVSCSICQIQQESLSNMTLLKQCTQSSSNIIFPMSRMEKPTKI